MERDFEKGAEEFLQQIVRENYLNGAGLKETVDIVSIFNKYGWLFDRSAVEKMLGREDNEGRYLAEFAADGYLDDHVKELSEKITNEITKATVEWQGEQIPYRHASIIIANEPDSGKRHDLESKVQAKTEDQNPDRITRMQKLHAQATSLGFASYLDMYDELKRLHLRLLREQADELLDQTEDIYTKELEHHLEAVGVAAQDATSADLAYLFRSPQFDPLFPKEKLVPSLKATLLGLGIDLDAQKDVRLDTEERPLKSPRAFCAPVHIPEEVYLVISPRGGQDDYKAILHESGHAEHFGHVRPDLPFAFRRLGDISTSESYAFLMDNLIKNQRWFSEIMDQHHMDDYLRLSRFHKLWIIRRYAAKLQYEMDLHVRPDIGLMRDEYARTLSRALRIKISPTNFLSDVDDALYVAQYLRAWIFEVMLRKHLEDSFGALWFRKKEAGDFLTGLWSEGQKYPVEELAHRLHYETLTAEPLMQELAR